MHLRRYHPGWHDHYPLWALRFGPFALTTALLWCGVCLRFGILEPLLTVGSPLAVVGRLNLKGARGEAVSRSKGVQRSRLGFWAVLNAHRHFKDRLLEALRLCWWLRHDSRLWAAVLYVQGCIKAYRPPAVLQSLGVYLYKDIRGLSFRQLVLPSGCMCRCGQPSGYIYIYIYIRLNTKSK